MKNLMQKTYEQLPKREKIFSIVANALFFIVCISIMMVMLGIVSSL